MLEIFLVFRLSRDVGKIAERKGLSLRRWKNYAVLLWFGFEILGFMIALSVFEEMPAMWLLTGYGLPVLVHVLLRQNLKRRPDADRDMDDWINQIGTDSTDPLPVIEN